MDLDLAGRSAVVTGGSKGIGLAIVRGLATAGAQVSPKREDLTTTKLSSNALTSKDASSGALRA